MNVSAVTTPLPLQASTPAEPVAQAPGAAPASSFDAMLAAVPPAGEARDPAPTQPPAQDKKDEDKKDAPADASAPDPSQAVALVAIPVAAAPPPLAHTVPSSGDAGAISLASVTNNAPPPLALPQVADADQPVLADAAAPTAPPPGDDSGTPGGTPVASAGARVTPVAPMPTPVAPITPAAPVASTASAAPAASAGSAIPTAAVAPAVSIASASVVLAAHGKPVASAASAKPIAPTSAPNVAAIDLDALFPRGGDKPLNVTFPGTATTTPPPAAALPPQAAIAALAPALVKVPGTPATDQRDGAVVSTTVDKSDAASSPTTTGAPVIPATMVMATASQPTPAASAAPASPADAAFQHHLNLAQDGAWLDGLARDIARSADGSGALSFRITPERLGSLQVTLAAGTDGTSIRLTADTLAAHALLTDSRHALVAQAESHGMRVADARIDLASNTGQGSVGTPSDQRGQTASGGHNGGGGREARANLLTILPQTGMQGGKAAMPAPKRERYA